MMGTLASVMAGKKIRTFKDRFVASVTGDIEDLENILKITQINVNYLLKLPERQRDAAIECFNNYIHLCPAAQSVIQRTRFVLTVPSNPLSIPLCCKS